MKGAAGPTIQPLLVGTRRGVRTVVVDCPFYPGRHIHGWPLGDPEPGPRTAHCGTQPTSYRIEAPRDGRE